MCNLDEEPISLYHLALMCRVASSATKLPLVSFIIHSLQSCLTTFLSATSTMVRTFLGGTEGERVFVDWFYECYTSPAASAAVATGCFSVILMLSGFFMVLSRSWFMSVSLVAIAMEVIGLVTRVVSVLQPDDYVSFIISTIFLLLAPSIQAANLYMLASRMIRTSTPRRYQPFKQLWLDVNNLTTVFIVQDIVAMAIQLSGAVSLIGVIINGTTAQELLQRRAASILVFGFGIQVISFLLFGALLWRFYLMSKKDFEWMGMMYFVIGCSTGLLIIRTIYRLSGFTSTTTLPSNFLVSDGWQFWVFEITAVLLMFLSYLVPKYPGMWFVRGGPLEVVYTKPSEPGALEKVIGLDMIEFES
ncbi:hypothetical protein TWF694_000970 [Orbilia ellipsospora]|uniref:Uncharacterized protein n=1 Tax=Orbilia ellipsospora TaxID=2528407 RepID=A0AAV9XQD8_9PEZI